MTHLTALLLLASVLRADTAVCEIVPDPSLPGQVFPEVEFSAGRATGVYTEVESHAGSTIVSTDRKLWPCWWENHPDGESVPRCVQGLLPLRAASDPGFELGTSWIMRVGIYRDNPDGTTTYGGTADCCDADNLDSHGQCDRIMGWHTPICSTYEIRTNRCEGVR